MLALESHACPRSYRLCSGNVFHSCCLIETWYSTSLAFFCTFFRGLGSMDEDRWCESHVMRMNWAVYCPAM